MFDPFNNYLGLNELVRDRVVKNDGESLSTCLGLGQPCQPSPRLQVQRPTTEMLDDFNANGENAGAK